MWLPRTIFRFVSLELWRLVLLTAGVLVAVGAFAITLTPLTRGEIGPLELLRYMAIAAVPMLQYALPFAGGFAATLAYHRMAADNELTACYAGGVSHARLLRPALLCGLALALAMLLLADQAMPRALRTMKEMVTDDIAQILAARVQRGEAFVRDDRVLYADRLTVMPEEERRRAGAQQVFVLDGVVLARIDRDGAIREEGSASQAFVWLYPVGAAPDPAANPADPDAALGDATLVVMRLRDAVGVAPRGGRGDSEESTFTFQVSNTFSDDPKYHSWAAMNAAHDRPERMNRVDRDRRVLAARMAERQVKQSLLGRLQPAPAAESARLLFVDPAGRSVILRTGGVAESGAAPVAPGAAPVGLPGALELRPMPDGWIEASVVLEDGRVRRHRARRAVLSAPRGQLEDRTVLDLRLEQVATSGATRTADETAPDTGALRASYEIRGLSPDDDPLPDLLKSDIDSLLARGQSASAATPADASLRAAAAALRKRVDNLRREIRSKQHERVAASLACVVMVLCGAVMAMRLRDGTPLVVYLWSFLPALAALLTISGGQRMTANVGPVGLLLLYGGVAALAAFTLVEWRRLVRH